MYSRRHMFRIGLVGACVFVLLASHSFAQGLFGNLLGGGSSKSGQQGLLGQLFDADTNAGPIFDFYVGRDVSARVLGASKYLPMDHPTVRYVNHVCRTLVLASQEPYTYKPFTCIVLNSDDLNAFASPGGVIFITRGLLNFLRNEDELATVLGHEISHIALRHAIFSVGRENAKNVMSKNLYAGKNGKSTAVSEWVGGMYSGMLNGYSIEMETEADENGMRLAAKAGYCPGVFPGVLDRFKTVKNHYGGAGYPAERSAKASRFLQTMPTRPRVVQERTARFQQNTAALH